VFVVGLEEGLFPSNMVGENMREMEEERRLLYVAMTRAKQVCTLSWAKMRYRYGNMEYQSPSRFLNDIDPRFLSRQESTGRSRQDAPAGRFGNRFGNRFGGRIDSRPTPSPPPTGNRRLVSIPQSDPAAPSSAASSPYPDLVVGSIIEHNRFGIGKVEAIEDSGDNCKATIRFVNAGIKTLLLRYAKLQILK